MRTLHHYDEVGLLKPATRGSSGHRLYDHENVLRLQQIMTYRTLGLPLDEIAQLLDDPSFDRREALIAQRKAVSEQIVQAEALIRGIDEALALIGRKSRKDMNMTTLFGGFDPSQFENETEARWGRTEEWRTSTRRAEKYSEEDWARYHAEHNAICADFAELAETGADAKSGRARQLVRAYAALIDDWFYPCDVHQMGALADMYEGDVRFRETFEKHGTGTSALVIEAFRSYADDIVSGS